MGQSGYNAASRSGWNSGSGWNSHQGNWSGGNWNGNNRWGNYYYGGYGRGWGLGGWGYWPWFAGWGLGWGYPGGYNYYYPNSDSYYYSYAPTTTVVGSGDQTPSVPAQPPAGSSSASMNSDDQQAANEGLQYYSDARSAFQQGDYRHALRLAGHAAVEAPGNPKVHELIALSLFALGNYSAAASEAHAAMAAGPIPEWKDLYPYYENVDTYTTQLRALEKAAAERPQSAAEHFLLGYQYLMTGARDNAKTEFTEAVKLTPKDKLAAHYLEQLNSNAAITPPQMATQPNSQPR
jgi:tetratricopeptide (TPR) repeat protein